MKKVALLLLCLAFAVSATERINYGSGSAGESSLIKGSYVLLESYSVEVAAGFGMAIKDDVANSIWISDWSDCFNYEFDMTNGNPTGDGWDITDGIDADDMGYCEYGSGNQFFFGDYTFSNIGVFSDAGAYVKSIDGPGGWANVFGMGAGHDMLYCARSSEIAWGSYTGTETEVTWTVEAVPAGIYGLAVYGDNLFLCNSVDTPGEDNIFIYDINADGSVNLTPVWSCEFTENSNSTNGGIDWDGTYLWIYPQQDMLYKLDIDWVPGSLENTTWGQIKADF
ncbi:MAG: hypothetical protein KAW14_02460 [Candidatus Aegiribacteria sp.]|nr:hypothetical protein [Candidatus Aegiribacteria sp.]